MKEYQICTRCIMDTSDPDITFDENGVCNHCHDYDWMVEHYGYKGAESDKQLKALVTKIKEECKNDEFDCVLGISGGVDSSYLAYLSNELGLRVLAVHVDGGWNSPVAEDNIKKICDKLNIKLHKMVIDWETMKELQRAYMFSGLANLDIPQDHAIIAASAQFAKQHGVKYSLNGNNLATEGILPSAWGYTHSDWKHIKGVYKKCGRGYPLKKYPHDNFMMLHSYFMKVRGRRLEVLNLTPYSQKGAIETLNREYGWQYYGGKHFESVFTRFFQSYYLPAKFGYDKRRAHLASLVVGGEMTREAALDAMDNPNYYPQSQMEEDRDYILNKLEISEEEWSRIMAAPIKTAAEYPSNQKLMRALVQIAALFRRYTAIFRKNG